MSTKDLMDRLETARPSAGKAKATPEPKSPAPASNETTRVDKNVVRRRASATPEPPPPPPAAPKTIRRPGARDEQPAARPPVAAAPQPAATTLRRPAAPPVSAPVRPAAPPVVAAPELGQAPPVVAAEPVEPIEAVVEHAAPAQVEAPVAEPVSAPEVEAAPVVEAAPAPVAFEPAPMPEAAEPAPVFEPTAAEEPMAAAPEVVPAVVAVPVGDPVLPTFERAVIVDRPGGTARLPHQASPASRAAQPRAMPDAPILPGLGRAVVSLPAGYDPTDPTGARRRAREQASTGGPRWGAGARPGGAVPPRGGPVAPAPGTEAPGGADRDRKRGRRGERSEHVPGQIEPRFRKPKRGAKDLRSSRPAQVVKRRVFIEGEITVASLAHEFGVKAAELIKLLMSMGQPATVNQPIDFDIATILAGELGHEVINTAFQESEHLIQSEHGEDSELPERPPVVTVMGHVDHGKTTLLDTIRKAKVAAGEAGGITQHIGAYQVKRGDRAVTFIDTPGHAAFSAMRARGARATDIVVLVVAADDGVMPQTIEAINHAKAADVPIVVAINKMDKPGATPERIKQQLMEYGLVPEEFGGETIMVPVSALKGTGVDDLLDNLLIVAEVEDLRANPERHGQGVVLESRLETGRGPVASLLVQTGTLKQGDTLVIGNTWGRVRAMADDRGAKIKEAGPSTPVEIIGLQDVPNAGDEFVVVESEKDARALVDHRQDAAKALAFGQRTRMTVEDLYKSGGEVLPIQHIILKADVSGSLEALKGALEGMSVSGTQLKILHAAIGPVNESDINLAAANGGLCIAFGVKADAKARSAADQYGVEIKRYDIIYNVIDDVKARLEGMLAPIYEEQKVGEAEIRALFKIPRIGFIAGCMVLEGKITRNAQAKVFRDGKEIYEGKVTSLKRFKEDVREVEKGFECGLGVEGATDIKEGDRIQVYTRVQVPRSS